MTISKLENTVKPLDEINKINEIIDDKVSKSGDTMTGSLAIEASSGEPIKIRDTNLVKGTAPEENHYKSVRYLDSNDDDLGGLQHRYLTDGSMALSLTIPSLTQANTYNGIYAISNPDGTFTTQAPTPPSGDNSTKIATTAFVNTDFLPKSGGTVDWLNVNGSLQREGTGTPSIAIKNTEIERGVAPSTNRGAHYYHMTDKNGAVIGQVATELYTNRRNVVKLQVYSADGTTAPAIRVNAYADNTVGFEFPKCTTKATKTSSARNDLVAVVVQNYVNGTSWYRVWSDGWIEQGGQCTCGDTVTFLKAFSNTNYTPIATRRDQSGQNFPMCIQSRTTTKMAVTASGDTGGNWKASWYACGY